MRFRDALWHRIGHDRGDARLHLGDRDGVADLLDLLGLRAGELVGLVIRGEAHRRSEFLGLQHPEKDVVGRAGLDECAVTEGAADRRWRVEAVDARGLARPLAELRGDEGELAALGRRHGRHGVIDAARQRAAVAMRDGHDHPEAALGRNRRHRVVGARASLT